MPRNARLLTGLLAIAIILTTGAEQGSADDLLRTEYYAGVCQTSFVGGNLFLQSSFIMERVIDPASSSITEHMLLFDRGGAIRENSRVFDIEGDSFAMSDSGTQLRVTGVLGGDAWSWTNVSYRASDESGSSVESDSELSVEGLYRETLIRDSDERVVVYIDEYASPLTAQQYGLLLERLQELKPGIKQA